MSASSESGCVERPDASRSGLCWVILMAPALTTKEIQNNLFISTVN